MPTNKITFQSNFLNTASSRHLKTQYQIRSVTRLGMRTPTKWRNQNITVDTCFRTFATKSNCAKPKRNDRPWKQFNYPKLYKPHGCRCYDISSTNKKGWRLYNLGFMIYKAWKYQSETNTTFRRVENNEMVILRKIRNVSVGIASKTAVTPHQVLDLMWKQRQKTMPNCNKLLLWLHWNQSSKHDCALQKKKWTTFPD